MSDVSHAETPGTSHIECAEHDIEQFLHLALHTVRADRAFIVASVDERLTVAATAAGEDVSSAFLPANLHELDEIVVRDVISSGKLREISSTTRSAVCVPISLPDHPGRRSTWRSMER
ncbi:hypothetical protein ACCS84_26145 [Rhizobium ruizarguesonis]